MNDIKTIKKIIKSLNSYGFNAKLGEIDNDEKVVLIESYDINLCDRLHGWQWKIIHECFTEYKCDFSIFIKQYEDAEYYVLSPLSAEETADGYDFDYISEYCKK